MPAGEMALPWVVLGTGLALALLVATLLEHLSRRRSWAERLVAERTSELAASLAETRDANEALAVARAEAERRSRVDALTGAYNRQHLLVELSAELNRAVRAVNEPALVLLEVDGFAQLNEEQGLAAGDAVLVEVARRLRTSLRSYDCIARWRGDQFALLVADVPDDPTLWKIADTVRQVVALGRIPVDGLDLWATASVGAARATPTLRHPDALVDAADAALRAARRDGPDRTVVHANAAGAQPEPEAIRIAESLAVSAALREGMPEQHCHHVARLAGLVAEQLGQPEDAVVRTRVAGWLHDLGKVSIPDRILAKPDALDEEDWRVMRTHPALGEEIVLRIPALAASAGAIRHHHERWDGSGYPDGLAGESIPLDARIVAAADVYVSMTSEPPFRRARDHRAALAELRASAGSQLDPRVVEALVTVLERERRGRAAANVEGEVDA
ncbi:MAG: diguanylate cyclase [Thermoleophilia bacterium]